MTKPLTNSLMNKPLYGLAGPTASGKTAVALAAAASLNAEIISVDSALVYQGLDIGSAKPSHQEQAQVVHHLIDCVQPDASYSVNQFLHDAKKLVTEIQARGKNVLFVGGTMLYFKALVQGLSQLPKQDAAIRQRLAIQWDQSNGHQLYQRLQQLDPVTAERVKSNDRQRIIRALEVIEQTSRPFSQVLQTAGHIQGLDQPLALIGLVPNDRARLHQRIEQRFVQMLQDGLIQEVEQLQKDYPHLTEAHSSMRSVGYRQVWAYLAGQYDQATLQHKGIAATRQLAKRQLTWLRNWSDPMVRLDPFDQPDLAKRCCQLWQQS